MYTIEKHLKHLAWATLLSSGAIPAAHAANWLQLEGNEPANAPAVRIFGFLQPAYESYFANPVEGAANAAFNGKQPQFNRVAPDDDSSSSFVLNRARIGVRGVLRPVSSRVNYFVLVEFAHNGITKNASAVELTDASLTFNYIPGARLRVGQFKYPGPEEGLESIPLVDPYVEFSTVTGQLIMGRSFQPAPTGSPAAPAGTAGAEQVGGVDAFRDTGVQVYDWFNFGHWEVAYAGMVGNGSTLNSEDENSNKQLTGRVQGSYIFGGKGPFRQDVTGWLWYQTGKRTFAGVDYSRRREGLGLEYNLKPLRVTGEYMRGTGVIFNGVNPPFNDPSIPTVATVALDSANKGRGWYLEAGYDVLPNVQLEARYDTYDRLPNSPALERRFDTWTLGAQYFITPKMRVTLNYAIRDLKLGNPAAIANAGQRSNAEAIASSMGNLLALQASLFF